MVEQCVEPTMLRNFAEVCEVRMDFAWRPTVHDLRMGVRGTICRTFVRRGADGQEHHGFNLHCEMRDSHIELPGFAGRLFTSQRGRRVFWYAGLGCCLWLMWARGGTGVYAQTTANVADEGW